MFPQTHALQLSGGTVLWQKHNKAVTLAGIGCFVPGPSPSLLPLNHVVSCISLPHAPSHNVHPLPQAHNNRVRWLWIETFESMSQNTACLP